MLGSFADAEDVLQDTLLAAWQGIGGFTEERASLRTWLYRIATNRCLNALRSARRRPAREWDVPGVDRPEPTRLGEVVWLEPYPSALLDGIPPGPEARYEQAEDAIAARFVSAWEAADLDALVALLTDDVFVSMPPMPFEYRGRDAAARFSAAILGSGLRFDLVPARANGQPAFGAYLRAPAGVRRGTGLYVLSLAGDRICAMTRFDSSVLPWFGLPRSLPGRSGDPAVTAPA
jgi:RNA polymerase sigma factor (sigma-70 family)